MDKEYLVIVRFDSKAEADRLVAHLDEMAGRGEMKGNFGSAEAYWPFHYMADVVEIVVLKIKAFFQGV